MADLINESRKIALTLPVNRFNKINISQKFMSDFQGT